VALSNPPHKWFYISNPTHKWLYQIHHTSGSIKSTTQVAYQIHHTSGSIKSTIQVALSNLPYKWLYQIHHTSGSIKSTTQMALSNPPNKWLYQSHQYQTTRYSRLNLQLPHSMGFKLLQPNSSPSCLVKLAQLYLRNQSIKEPQIKSTKLLNVMHCVSGKIWGR
jgi:hypothetical protein